MSLFLVVILTIRRHYSFRTGIGYIDTSFFIVAYISMSLILVRGMAASVNTQKQVTTEEIIEPKQKIEEQIYTVFDKFPDGVMLVQQKSNHLDLDFSGSNYVS